MKKVLKWGGIVLAAIIVVYLIDTKGGKTKEITPTKTAEVGATSSSKVEIIEVVPERTGAGMLIVHVTIKNNTAQLLTAGGLKALLYNESGKLVGTAPGTLLNIPAGETKVVDCLTMDVPTATNAKAQVEYSMFE